MLEARGLVLQSLGSHGAAVADFTESIEQSEAALQTLAGPSERAAALGFGASSILSPERIGEIYLHRARSLLELGKAKVRAAGYTF